jgi:hypothetical protein
VRFDPLKASHVLRFVISISKAEDKERKEVKKKEEEEEEEEGVTKRTKNGERLTKSH